MGDGFVQDTRYNIALEQYPPNILQADDVVLQECLFKKAESPLDSIDESMP
jgi:hypothetical protein